MYFFLNLCTIFDYTIILIHHIFDLTSTSSSVNLHPNCTLARDWESIENRWNWVGNGERKRKEGKSESDFLIFSNVKQEAAIHELRRNLSRNQAKKLYIFYKNYLHFYFSDLILVHLCWSFNYSFWHLLVNNVSFLWIAVAREDDGNVWNETEMDCTKVLDVFYWSTTHK